MSCGNGSAFLRVDSGDRAFFGSDDLVLHFHCFDDENGLARLDSLSDGGFDVEDGAGKGRGDCAGACRGSYGSCCGSGSRLGCGSGGSRLRRGRRLRKRRFVFFRDDRFAFLDKGLIRLSSLGENGSERIFLHIGAGCIFNELSCMHVAPLSTASFLAMEPCEIYQFPKSLLENRDFVLQYPELMMNLVQSLMLKAGAFFGQIEESVGLSPENLVCRYLFRLQEDASLHLRPKFSQSDLALALGLHRSTVCRVLHDLRERGILGEFTRTKLEILDREGLRDMCRTGNK